MKKNFIKAGLAAMLIGTMIFTTACSSSSSEETTATAASENTTDVATEAGITSFEDLNTDKVELIALGNSDVPVGQYSEEIITNLGFWNDIQSKITFADNVKEVLAQVESGSVDCGIVYATDAATSDGVTVVCEAPEGSLETPVVYPVAMLNNAKNEEASKVFLNYLLTDDALSEFKAVGFSVAAEDEAEEMDYTGEACTLTIFAAASLTESLTAVADDFMAEYPNINVVLNLDSSGTLQTQIEEGAEADIFFSAAAKQMTALSDKGYIADDTTIKLLENKVVLVVPAE